MKVSVFPKELSAKIRKSGVIAVLVIDNADDAVPLAEALLAGGIVSMELTLRTPAAVAALKKIVQSTPEMSPGIGTILSPEQVGEVKAAGAAFGLAPGVNPQVVQAATSAGFPFVPGVATPTEIEMALGFGCRLLKFFPAENCGGLKYLESIAAPYAHLGCEYIPLGGLNQENMAEYLKNSAVSAVGGSWIAKREEIAQHKWQAITDKARKAVDAIKNIRG
jgi:2-dehydro-3-deoxyphosphogluconate aldolase/(4S)-4-hydroxy-2-oxoglutarate aldolase